MNERVTYLATVGLLLALTLGSVLLAGTGAGAGPVAPEADEADYRTTDDGTRYLVEPDRLLQGCPGGQDCIPAIDDPNFQSAGGADWLAADDLVIGVEIDGEAKAYPLRVLTLHEIVNDEVGGTPVAVTYCPLCRSGLVFDRRVGGTTLEFGVSGKLLNANLVMYDKATETYWSQLNGTAIVGPQVPRELDIVASSITTWGEWRETHPETRVLSRDTGIFPKSAYGRNPYGSFEDSDRVGFDVDDPDDRLHSKTVVYGVAVGNESRAYPEEAVRRAGAVNDEVGGVSVLVVADADDGGIKVYERRVDGEPVEFALEDGQLVDGDGNRWSFDGEALEGPKEGTQLERLNSHGIYWFAWSEFHPETEIYRGNETDVG